jgi:hypothetical protein
MVQRCWSFLYALAAGGLATALAAVMPGKWRWPVAGGAGLLVAAFAYHAGMRRIRRRRRLVAAGIDDAARAILADRVRGYSRLDGAGRRRCEGLCAILLDEVRIAGVGCELTFADRLGIVASAAVLVVGLPGWEYDDLRQVLVYPACFDGPGDAGRPPGDSSGMVFEGDGLMAGLVILSLPDLRAGQAGEEGWGDVAIHEFAHLVDRAIDGQMPAATWRDRLAAARARTAGRGLLPDDAFEDDTEYFATLSECFFGDPARLRRWSPELYDLLAERYRQDPATRV